METPLKLRMLCLIVLCASCSTTSESIEKPPEIPAIDIKIYSVQPEGLVRKQSNETLSLDAAKGFVAMSFDDFLKLLSSCPN